MAVRTLLDGKLQLAGRLDARFFTLLSAIAATGSINRAARTAGYSYKGAWLLLETAQHLTRAPLVLTAPGNRRRGTRLTPEAEALLRAWDDLQRAHHDFLDAEEARLLSNPALAGLLKRLSMKTSARNQFAGTITALENDAGGVRVTLALPGDQRIVAAMRTASAASLGVAAGREAIALVKASTVMLVTDFAGYQLADGNQLSGTISRVARGAVSATVGLTLPGGAVITATITNDAVDALGLAAGMPATAVFSVCAVLLAVRQP